MRAKAKGASEDQPYTAELLNPLPLFIPTATPSRNYYYSQLMGGGTEALGLTPGCTAVKAEIQLKCASGRPPLTYSAEANKAGGGIQQNGTKLQDRPPGAFRTLCFLTPPSPTWTEGASQHGSSSELGDHPGNPGRAWGIRLAPWPYCPNPCWGLLNEGGHPCSRGRGELTKDLAGKPCRLPQQVQMPGSVEQGAPTGNEGEVPLRCHLCRCSRKGLSQQNQGRAFFNLNLPNPESKARTASVACFSSRPAPRTAAASQPSPLVCSVPSPPAK